MKYSYVAVFTPEERGLIAVHFPDLEGCSTSGDNVTDALYMAQDVLGLTLYDMEQDGIAAPVPSVPSDIAIHDGQFTSLVAADTQEYRRLFDNKAIKKTLTIPMWLNERAERENINFSGLLQEALKERLEQLSQTWRL